MSHKYLPIFLLLAACSNDSDPMTLRVWPDGDNCVATLGDVRFTLPAEEQAFIQQTRTYGVLAQDIRVRGNRGDSRCVAPAMWLLRRAQATDAMPPLGLPRIAPQ